MLYVMVGVLSLCLPGLWALGRAETEIRERGGIGPLTFIAAYAAFTLHGLATALAGATGTWPVALPIAWAWGLGVAAAAAGAAVNVAGRLSFRSFRLMWGLDSDRLVTSGVYQVSRNPQCLGWLLIYMGLAIAGRSGAALLLSGAFLAGLWVWLPFEERALVERFGETYLRYRSGVPRLIGFPRGRRDNGVLGIVQTEPGSVPMQPQHFEKEATCHAATSRVTPTSRSDKLRTLRRVTSAEASRPGRPRAALGRP